MDRLRFHHRNGGRPRPGGRGRDGLRGGARLILGSVQRGAGGCCRARARRSARHRGERTGALYLRPLAGQPARARARLVPTGGRVSNSAALVPSSAAMASPNAATARPSGSIQPTQDRAASSSRSEPTPTPASPSRCAGAATAATSSSAIMTRTCSRSASTGPWRWSMRRGREPQGKSRTIPNLRPPPRDRYSPPASTASPAMHQARRKRLTCQLPLAGAPLGLAS